MAALRLHLDVDAAGRLQRQDVRPVRGLVDLLPETRALQGTGHDAAARERAGRRPRDVAQRRHGTPAGGDTPRVYRENNQGRKDKMPLSTDTVRNYASPKVV